MAGDPCPIEIMRRVIDTMHCRHMLVVYGQTEASPGITSSRVDDDLETRCTTVGCALPETEVRIISSDGETLPVGQQGELLARTAAQIELAFHRPCNAVRRQRSWS